MNLKPSPCPDCGYEPAFHEFERWSLVVDDVSGFLLRPFGYINSVISVITAPVIDFIAPVFAKILSFFRLASIRKEFDKEDTENTICLWEEATRRGIEINQVCILGLRRRLFIAKYDGKTIAFEGLPRPARRVTSLSWVDDKMKLKRRFEKKGFPVARGDVAKTDAEAISIFNNLNKPVIAKPHIGSGGRHTFLNIADMASLKKAFHSAGRLSPKVIVEEQLDGPVIRATLIAGKIVGVLRRDPPKVVGDGKKTVRELVVEENKNPLRNGPTFAKISFDDPVVSGELKRQNISWEDIPKSGRVVLLHFKVNWGVGGTSEDVTDITHADNMELFKSIAEYLDDDIVGIDFITPDITKSWKNTKLCGVIECNSLPFIANHHIPFSGKSRNVAGAIWDMTFPESSPIKAK